MNLDKDLAARQEARELCAAAASAQKVLATYPQERLVLVYGRLFLPAAGV